MLRPGGGLGPEERRPRIAAFECPPVVPDLADEHAPWLEMAGRLAQDAAHDLEAVCASGQGASRLVAVLRRKAAHARIRHVRRIAEDEIVTPLRQGAEQVRTNKVNPMLQPMQGDIALRDRERGARVVAGVDPGSRKRVGSEDRKAGGTGTQVEDAAHGTLDPGFESLTQQFRDE